MMEESATVAYLQETVAPVRLSCTTESGWPIVLSLWYVYLGGKLYCATKSTAKVTRYLQRDPRCAFEVSSNNPPYRGIRGQGKALLNKDRGQEILKILLNRYLKGTESPLAGNLLSKSQDEIAIEIKPISMHRWDYTNRMADSIPRS